MDIDGWTLRVGNDRSRKVPAGGAIPPGGTVTVHVGYGANSLTDRFLGSSVPMLQNADQTGRQHLGSRRLPGRPAGGHAGAHDLAVLRRLRRPDGRRACGSRRC